MLTMWSKARELAEMTPPERNRWVDFLRAVSIMAVVIGHWLMAGLYVDASGELRRGDLLSVAEWTHWLTWGFQVMPVFFLVGGYSNSVSWAATTAKAPLTQDGVYRDWLASRVQRLITPTFPVLLLWAWAVWVWAGAEPAQRSDLLWGSTWRVCSSNVAITALPMLALALWYLRGLAPTRPGWAGAAAGWLAGGVGAAAYALHCPEMDAPFLAVWYVLGMCVPTALGAVAAVLKL